MVFKHWKEAEKRATELKAEIDSLNADISSSETEARNEEISVEKRGEIITALQVKVDKRDALQSEYDDTMKAMDTLKASEERQLSFLANLTTPRVAERREDSQPDSVYETRSYELAWANYIRTGNDLEVRSLVSTGSTGILVPTTLVNKIEDVMLTGGRLINLCDIINIKGIAEYPVAVSKTDPELHDETGSTEKKEKAITLTSVSMDPQFIAEILRTTRKFEADSISAFWDWLMSELPDALKRAIDKKILVGGQSATDGVHGILTNTNSLFVETLNNQSLDFNIANKAVAMLDDGIEDNVTIVMHRKTFYNNLMGLRGSDGHPIYKQIMTSNLNRPSFTLGGYPVVFSNELPAYDDAVTDEVYMVAGNFKAYKLNFPEGMRVEIERDAITEMQNNFVRYLSEIYAAGNITRPKSFVKVTK